MLTLALGAARADDVTSRLGEYTTDGVSVRVPRHWVVTADVKQGTLVARQDPRRKDAAQLLLTVKQAAAGTSEDALLDALAAAVAHDAKAGTRQAFPGGRGRTLVADVIADGAKLRLGAVAVVGNGAAMVGALVAPSSEFDALGGLPLVAAVLASVHHMTDSDRTAAELSRDAKHDDRPDLDPDRPPIDKSAFARSWARGTGVTRYVEDSSNGVTSRGHLNPTGEGDSFDFHADGSYALVHVATTSGGGCVSTSNSNELGRYTLDGRTLVMTPKDVTASVRLCGAKARSQKLTSTAPRSYQVGLAPDGRLIMIGPSCGVDVAGSRCVDHARWEMKPATK